MGTGTILWTSGTGKTLSATSHGKHTDKDGFQIDPSRVVSEYIGETEKIS